MKGICLWDIFIILLFIPNNQTHHGFIHWIGNVETSEKNKGTNIWSNQKIPGRWKISIDGPINKMLKVNWQ